MIEEKFPDISQALLDDLKLCGEACRGMYAFWDIAVTMVTKHMHDFSHHPRSYQGLQ